MHWPTPMAHTSTASTEQLAATAWRQICAWAERKSQTSVAAEAFSCCTMKQPEIFKKMKNKMNCLFICMICLFIFHNVILNYPFSHYNKQLDLIALIYKLQENAHRPQLHLLCLFLSLIVTVVSVWFRASFSATVEHVVRIVLLLQWVWSLVVIHTISQSIPVTNTQERYALFFSYLIQGWKPLEDP